MNAWNDISTRAFNETWATRESRGTSMRMAAYGLAVQRGPGSDDDPRPLSPRSFSTGPRVVTCDRARATVVELRDELGFELEEVVIDDDPELETRFRELIPVVEIDGKQAFVYFVHSDALRRKLAQSPA